MFWVWGNGEPVTSPDGTIQKAEVNRLFSWRWRGCSWGSIITVVPPQPHKFPPNDVINPRQGQMTNEESQVLVRASDSWDPAFTFTFTCSLAANWRSLLEKKRHHEMTRSSQTLICGYQSTHCSLHPRIQLSPPSELVTLHLSSVRLALGQVFLRVLRFPLSISLHLFPISCFVQHDSSLSNWRR
jgi:hypothetical protein